MTVGSQTEPIASKPVHLTLGRLVSIEGHKKGGEPVFLEFDDRAPVLVADKNRKLDLVYSTRPTNPPTGNLRSVLDYAYTPLHEGAPAVAFYADKRRRPVGSKHFKCVVDAITYWKRTTEPAEHRYRHQFGLPESERVVLAIDDAGALWFENQESIVVTERGIEDKPMNKHDIMRANAYSEVAASRMRPFRDNPFTVEGVKRVGFSSGVVGIGVIAGLMGLQKLSTDGPAAYRGLSENKKALVEGIGGIALAVIGDAWLPEGNMQALSAIAGISGVVAGGTRAIAAYKAAHTTPVAAPQPTPAPAPSSGVGGVHNAYYQPQYGRTG